MSPDEGPVGTHGFLGLFCCLCHADIDCNLTIGHDTEQPDSKHKMILIPSSSARLGHTQQEGHNAEMYQRYIYNGCCQPGVVRRSSKSCLCCSQRHRSLMF